MSTNPKLTIDNLEIEINGEKNLLEVIRKANIELPTFCYHSELSVYGACRLCMVDVAGRGILPACSTPPENGLKVKTNTEEIREMRKIIVELLLANHEQTCPTCARSANCQLQNLARQLGISEVRFKSVHQPKPVDNSSLALVRDPNKCILCGDCVRICSELQGIGAIDFAFRGPNVAVLPAFGKDLDSVECINCGQCARVCPTGALTPKSEIEEVWKAINDPNKVVVAQIAPAVRVALGEYFGYEPGTILTGQMVSALKLLGFNKVFDTSFTADLTVLEESNEFLTRLSKNEKLPLFTSCCPGWVKFVEQFYPEMLTNLSSCKSPQQMFGSIAKELLPKQLGVAKENLVVVSIMPCTAKKFEAKRTEFQKDGIFDVDHVITTQELGKMIETAGVQFKKLNPESYDLPFGFKTGAGVIFGNTGGVTEAVLRYASEVVLNQKQDKYEFKEVRGEAGIRELEISLADKNLKIAIVHGLANAKNLVEKIKTGQAYYDFVEVMTCTGGCIGGAGQPISENIDVRKLRTEGIYQADKMLELHKSQQNMYVQELYNTTLVKPNSHEAHELLHTNYYSRKRICGEELALIESSQKGTINVSVCIGTSCYLRGAQNLLHRLIKYIEERKLTQLVEVKASFCFERCSKGPTVNINGEIFEKCTFEKACQVIDSLL